MHQQIRIDHDWVILFSLQTDSPSMARNGMIEVHCMDLNRISEHWLLLLQAIKDRFGLKVILLCDSGEGLAYPFLTNRSRKLECQCYIILPHYDRITDETG